MRLLETALTKLLAKHATRIYNVHEPYNWVFTSQLQLLALDKISKFTTLKFKHVKFILSQK